MRETEDTKRLLVIAGQLGKTQGLELARSTEAGRHQLGAIYGCHGVAADEIARLTKLYFRALEIVFAVAQQHTALQKQLNGASPYTQSAISVLVNSSRWQEVFVLLREIATLAMTVLKRNEIE